MYLPIHPTNCSRSYNKDEDSSKSRKIPRLVKSLSVSPPLSPRSDSIIPVSTCEHGTDSLISLSPRLDSMQDESTSFPLHPSDMIARSDNDCEERSIPEGFEAHFSPVEDKANVLPSLTITTSSSPLLANTTIERQLNSASPTSPISCNEQWSLGLSEAEKRASIVLHAKKKFNVNPKKGIDLLAQSGFFSFSPPEAQEIARFLAGESDDRLSKTAMGDYLGSG
jgi:Sec7-like guanine-nucleotide exchange factor